MQIERPEPTDVEREVTDIDLIVSRADAEGNITYTNPIFMKISGYSQGELLGKPHAILRHPDMPKVVFKYLWDNIKQGNDVVAYVKNLCKDGSCYWVLATVKMAKNPDGSFRNYLSTRRRMKGKAREVIPALYARWLEAEKEGGLEASEKLFNEFLAENGITDAESFNQFMQNLNN